MVETSAMVCTGHHIVIPAQSVLLGLQPLTTTAYSLRVKAGIQLVKQSPRSGQSRVPGVVPLRGAFVNRLDSRFRGNDGCGMVSVMNYVQINKVPLLSLLTRAVSGCDTLRVVTQPNDEGGKSKSFFADHFSSDGLTRFKFASAHTPFWEHWTILH